MDPVLLSKTLAFILLAEGYHGTPGDGGKAVGPYQIHMIYLKHCQKEYEMNILELKIVKLLVITWIE